MTTLETGRLILRPPSPEDAPAYALGMGEFDVARWLTAVPWPYTLAMAQDWLRQAPAPAPDRAMFIIERPGKGLVGCITLINDLGFWIARPHWNQGYATEAARAVISWHFAAGTDRPIACSAQQGNRASMRVQSRLGFEATGEEMRFSHTLHHNVRHVVTSLSRERWQSMEEEKCA